jgi:hypothetical protein
MRDIPAEAPRSVQDVSWRPEGSWVILKPARVSWAILEAL